MKNLFLSFGLLASWIGVQAQCAGLTPVTLPFTEGFESFSGTVVPSSKDSLLVCSGSYRWDYHRGGTKGNLMFEEDPFMGARSVAIASSSYGNDTNQVTLTINLSAYASSTSGIYTSFMYRNNMDFAHTADRVRVRGSQNDTWIDVINWVTEANGYEWTLAKFKIDSVLSLHSQNLSANTQIQFSQYGASDYRYDGFAVDEVMITEGMCSAPSGLSLVSASAGSAVIGWNANAGSTYEVAYDTLGTGIGNVITATSQPLTINGLEQGITYAVYIRENCTGGASSTWVGPISFSSPCIGYTAPYSTDFETAPYNNPEYCWAQYGNKSASYAEVRTMGSPFSGVQQIAFSNGYTQATDTAYAITPKLIGLTAGDKEVSFMAKPTKVAGTLIVGTLPDQSGKGMFAPLDTIHFSSTSDYQEVFVSVNVANGYNGTDEYVALKHDMSATYTTFYIDDFSYDVTPACPKPSNLITDNVSYTSVDIDLNDRGATAFEYIYGPPGFNQATVTAQSANSVPFTVTGLNANSPYELYVRAACGTGTSVWSQPINFTTKCTPVVAPYYNGFEFETLDEAPNCWTSYSTSTSMYARVDDARAVNTGNNSLVMYNSYSVGSTSKLMAITPAMGGITAGDKQLRFFANTSDVLSTLIVGTLPSPDHPELFTALDTITLPSANAYVQLVVKIDAANGYNGTDEYVALMHGLGTSTDYILIDDFNYEVQPACSPTQMLNMSIDYLTYDSVSVSWIPGDGSKFNVEVGVSGFTPGLGNSVIVTDTFAGFNGLMGSTTYDLYIQDSCNSGFTPYVGPLSFTTPCSPVVAPFIESFAGGTLPQCWEATTTTTSTSTALFWRFSGSTTGGAYNNGKATGTYAWVDGSSPANVNDVTLTTPFVDVSNVAVPQLYFEIFSNNTTDMGDNMFFYINFWDGAQWNDSIFTYAGDDANWQDYSLLLNNYNITGPVKFQFVVDKTTASKAYNNDILLDSVVVMEAPACPAPSSFTVDAFTANSATFSMGGYNAGSYEIQWGPMGFTHSTNTTAPNATTVSGITTVPYTLSGLNPNSSYDVYLRSDCGTDGYSEWVGPVTFTTPCLGPLAGGTYTIGKGPNDDFSSFDTVASVLNSCGISGPVVFNISGGRYNDALHLVDVNGTSAINTITFNSNGDTLMYNGRGAQAAVLFDNAKHITISGLTIMNMSGSEAWGILLTGNSDSVTIDNCYIEVDVTSVNNDNIPVVISGDYQNDQVSGSDVDYFTLSNSHLAGGYCSVSMEGQGIGVPSAGHKVVNNICEKFYYYGIMGDELTGVEISGNQISTKRYNNSRGIYFQNINDFDISGNSVDVGDYGIYINDGNDGVQVASHSKLTNNMVVSASDYGIGLIDIEKVDVQHNTVLGAPAMYLDQYDTIDVRNNIFVSHTDYAFRATSTLSSEVVLDYNLYHASGTKPAIMVNNVGYGQLAQFVAAYPAFNANSVQGNPLFVSNSDLHVRGVLADNAGDNTVGITVDIDGDVRPASGSTTVDMGADEYDAIGNDLGVVAILDPADYTCGDSTSVVTVVVRNDGANAASNFDVAVEVSGATYANMVATYSGTLASLAIDTVSVPSFNSINGGVITLKAYTMLSGDQFALNDSVSKTVEINDAAPVVIHASDSAFCVAQPVIFWVDTAFSSQSFLWRDENGNVLGQGDTLELPNVDSTTTVWAEVDTAGSGFQGRFKVGAVDSTMGSAVVTTTNLWHPMIAAYQQVMLQDMKIYPQRSGVLVIDLVDTATSAVVQTVTVPVTQTTAYMPVRVALNLLINPGVYEMRINSSSTTGQMMRNGTGGSYPYGDPSVFELVGQTFGLSNSYYKDYYYYFYDMTIASVAGCLRPASAFTVSFGDNTAAGFSYVAQSPTATSIDVDFDASSSVADAGSVYTWDFGDGYTGSGVNVSHTYTSNGAYTVKMVVESSCGKDSLTQQVVIQGISIEENALSRSLEIYPNPTHENINVVFDARSAQSAVVYLSDMTGKVLFSKGYNNMNGEFTGEISLENLPKGTYILNVKTDGLSAQRRIIKI